MAASNNTCFPACDQPAGHSNKSSEKHFPRCTQTHKRHFRMTRMSFENAEEVPGFAANTEGRSRGDADRAESKKSSGDQLAARY